MGGGAALGGGAMGPWRRAWRLACRSTDERRGANVNMCSEGVTCERQRVVRRRKKSKVKDELREKLGYTNSSCE